ncbi:hypothetical protein ACIBKY_44515 [Nonomuraea sp. NPDC050394]|uniref:hypothetical protein n=1 Tax=Nonomuraea sp. NPDC050394 TaxID=3364363 RepID=UPI00379CFA01
MKTRWASPRSTSDIPPTRAERRACWPSAGNVLSKLAETAEHAGEFAAQNWVGMDEAETADWRKILRDLEAATAATFRRTVNLID